MRFFILIFLGLFSFSGGALADCTAPAGIAGDQIFNAPYKTMQFCDGTLWYSMKGSSGGGGASPKGAIMAFNLVSCPSGWSEYTLARGRFLRGIDSTGINDPEGVRALGSTQDDIFESHSHVYGALHNAYPNMNWLGAGPAVGNWGPHTSAATGGAETRPKNVALLFCEKD